MDGQMTGAASGDEFCLWEAAKSLLEKLQTFLPDSGETWIQDFRLFVDFFFWLHLWHVEFPGPGIEPAPQQ